MDKGIIEEELMNSLGVEEIDKLKEMIKNKVLKSLRDIFKNLEIDFQIYGDYLVFYVSKLGFKEMKYEISFDLTRFGNKIFREDAIEYLIDVISIRLKSKWESYIIKENEVK